FGLEVKQFRNGHFPWHATEIKAHIETYKAFDPQLVFTHYRHDHHQDHRTVSELTANTFRNHLVLEYEILKYDGDLDNPNVFVPLTREQLNAKVDTLMRCFESQLDKQWFTPDVFAGIARIRGVHGACDTGFAEAFYNHKMTLT
ncbi:MAG: PIG-L family deacetylase, partial [Pseudomonadota bacterium]